MLIDNKNELIEGQETTTYQYLDNNIIEQTNQRRSSMEWDTPKEKNEPAEEKQVCQKCGNDTFRVYIKIIIDDARLYCAKCGEYYI